MQANLEKRRQTKCPVEGSPFQVSTAGHSRTRFHIAMNVATNHRLMGGGERVECHPPVIASEQNKSQQRDGIWTNFV